MEDADANQLIDALISVMYKNGSLKSAAIEQAFRDVPRHFFLPNEPLERAYKDIAIPVKNRMKGCQPALPPSRRSWRLCWNS